MSDIVTADDARPAGKPGECFYCNQPSGHPHGDDCVVPQRIVKVRAIIEFERSVPKNWDRHSIEFHLNESSWCADNAIGEIEAQADKSGCLCNCATFEYVGEVEAELEPSAT